MLFLLRDQPQGVHNVGAGNSHPVILNSSPLPSAAILFPSQNNPFPLRESRKFSAGMKESALSPEHVVQGCWACGGLLGPQIRGRRAPENFLPRKEASRGDRGMEGKGICKSYNKHQTSPFYTSFLWWGSTGEPFLFGKLKFESL